MSCPCPECNNDWGGKCLYERIAELEAEIMALKAARQNMRDLCESEKLARRQAERKLAEERARLDFDPNNYVAWLRYIRVAGITRIVVCDSDAPGAFRVYRRAAIDAARKPRSGKYGPCEHCGGPTDDEGECSKCRDFGGTDKRRADHSGPNQDTGSKKG